MVIEGPVDPSADCWQQLQSWSQQPLGQRFHAREYQILRDIFPSLFGYYLVALGQPIDRAAMDVSPVSRRWSMQACFSKENATDLLGAPEQLPLASDSIDVVVLSHVLECCIDPVAILKEVDRVLIAQGHVIILGFNPLSLWRGYFALQRRDSQHNPFRIIELCGISRLRSWLALLGLETLSVQYHSHGLPNLRGAEQAPLETLAARHGPFTGGGYVLLARKRVSTLTPIRPRWALRPLAPQSVASLHQCEANAPSRVVTEQEPS